MGYGSPSGGAQSIVEQIHSDQTLLVRARTILRNAIFNGQLLAGQKLIERELGEMTGVSRSILREALVHLEANGLVERQPYKGFRVAQPGSREVWEIFELRASLETQAAELFTERASDDEVSDLRRAFAELERCLEPFDPDRMRKAKERYYDVIFKGCRNVEIRRALGVVLDRIYFLRGRLISDPRRRQRSIREMARLTEALIERDRLGAREATIAHLLSARDAVLVILDRDGATARPATDGLSDD